jgi:3-oxoacyl-[acyl-carrier-protein] synthase II
VTEAVVITGLGTIGCFGPGRESLQVALAASAPAPTEVDRSAGYHRDGGSRFAALTHGTDLSAWIRPAAARRMSGPSKLAVAAASMAIADGGLEGASAGWDETGVFLATGFGPGDFTERLLRSIASDGPETASPSQFTESVANAPAAQIAIEWQARGPNVTVTQREAGPLIALARAAGEVAEGRASRVLAGSVDEVTPLLHALLDRFGALARALPGLPEAARPFDRRRNGMLAGDGSTVVLLETETSAAARGAKVLARVRGGGGGFDSTASRVGWGRGDGPLGAALLRFLARIGVRPGEIDLVVSGASGSRAGDRLEARVLGKAFSGVRMPPVLAPKSLAGEYGGAFLGTAVLAVGGGDFGATAGFAEPDPELGIVPHAGGRLAGGRVLVSSLAAGGAAGWVVLERP